MNSLPGSSSFYNLLQLGNLGGYATCRLGLYMEYTNYINISIDGSSTGSNRYTHSMVANQWYHICVTYDGTIVKLYINGNEVFSKTASKSSYTTAASNLYIGGTSSYYLNGYMNDARYYNHCLSPMEVKQISRGLILHYPLNRNGWGQENLAKNTAGVLVDKLNNALDSRTEYYAFNCGTPLNVSNGDKVTISFDLYEVVRTAGSGYLYIYNTNNKGPHQIVGVNALAGRTIAVGDIIDEHISFTTTISTRSDANQTNDFIEFYSTYGTNNFYKISNFKIEKGEIATPWCPNSSDALATAMGLNSTTEYDCSGFCNNGSKITDTITYSSDTAKYAVSTHFNGTYDGILIENLILKDVINSEVTYAFWIKPESESGARSVYFGSYNIGPSWSIEKTTGNVIRSYWNGSPDETCSGATIADGVWQHVCLTKKGTNDIKVYINGVQKWASTATHSDLNFPTTYRIGRDVRSNDGTPYKGLMSDFRIYATALSADEVKSLYQNSAYIDSSGNIYGAVHSEV